MKLNILYKKPKRLWEWREYKKGSLIENGIILNNTATFVWKLCNGKKTVNELILSFSKKYSIDKKRATEDVLECVSTLYKEKTLKF